MKTTPELSRRAFTKIASLPFLPMVLRGQTAAQQRFQDMIFLSSETEGVAVILRESDIASDKDSGFTTYLVRHPGKNLLSIEENDKTNIGTFTLNDPNGNPFEFKYTHSKQIHVLKASGFPVGGSRGQIEDDAKSFLHATPEEIRNLIAQAEVPLLPGQIAVLLPVVSAAPPTDSKKPGFLRRVETGLTNTVTRQPGTITNPTRPSAPTMAQTAPVIYIQRETPQHQR